MVFVKGKIPCQHFFLFRYFFVTIKVDLMTNDSIQDKKFYDYGIVFYCHFNYNWLLVSLVK